MERVGTGVVLRDLLTSTPSPRAATRRYALRLGNGTDGPLLTIVAPTSAARHAVVVCPGLHADNEKNHRRERLVQAAMAERGVVAARIDYRGQDGGWVSLDSVVADIWAATDFARGLSSSGRVDYLATRLGSTAALRAVTTGRVVVWDPVLDSESYLLGALRVRAMTDLRQGGRRPREEVVAALQREGSVEICGYCVSLDLLRSIPPSAELLAAASQVDLRVGVLDPRTSDHSLLDAPLDRTFVSPRREAWWFDDDPHRIERTPHEFRPLLDATVDWLEAP